MYQKLQTWMLALALVWIGGCARSDYAVSPSERSSLTRVENQQMAAAKDAPAPKILPDTYFAAGRLLEAQGNSGAAVVQYRKALAVDDKFVEAHQRLGQLLSKAGQHDEAYRHLRRAVQLDPKSAVLHNDLGYQLMLQRSWADAERELRKATALDPNFTRAHVNLGMTQARLGRFDEAFDSFRAVLPEPDAYYNLGLMYRAQQRWDEAENAFRTALEIEPRFTAAEQQIDQLAAARRNEADFERPSQAATIIQDAAPTNARHNARTPSPSDRSSRRGPQSSTPDSRQERRPASNNGTTAHRDSGNADQWNEFVRARQQQRPTGLNFDDGREYPAEPLTQYGANEQPGSTHTIRTGQADSDLIGGRTNDSFFDGRVYPARREFAETPQRKRQDRFSGHPREDGSHRRGRGTTQTSDAGGAGYREYPARPQDLRVETPVRSRQGRDLSSRIRDAQDRLAGRSHDLAGLRSEIECLEEEIRDAAALRAQAAWRDRVVQNSFAQLPVRRSTLAARTQALADAYPWGFCVAEPVSYINDNIVVDDPLAIELFVDRPAAHSCSMWTELVYGEDGRVGHPALRDYLVTIDPAVVPSGVVSTGQAFAGGVAPQRTTLSSRVELASQQMAPQQIRIWILPRQQAQVCPADHPWQPDVIDSPQAWIDHSSGQDEFFSIIMNDLRCLEEQARSHTN